MNDIQYANYDFGLTAEQEARAQRLHTDSVIVDLTYQGPCSPDVWTPELEAESKGSADTTGFLERKAIKGELPIYKENFDASGVTCGVTGFVLDDRTALTGAAIANARKYSGFDWLRPALRADDIRE